MSRFSTCDPGSLPICPALLRIRSSATSTKVGCSWGFGDPDSRSASRFLHRTNQVPCHSRALSTVAEAYCLVFDFGGADCDDCANTLGFYLARMSFDSEYFQWDRFERFVTAVQEMAARTAA